jgi:thiamine biosynthesis lipoprotein
MSHMRRHDLRLRPAFRALAMLTLPLLAATAQAAWYQREDAIMGTRVAVELWSENPALAERAMQAVLEEMRRTDELMSHYKPESQLSAVNAHAAERPVEVDPTIVEVVARALEFSRISGGAFDITYASVGYLYDYRAHQKPSEAQIEQALPGVDYRRVQVDRVASTIRFTAPGVRIDLGGIAKGYAVDRSIEILRKLGIRHAMVNAGGDTRLLGDRRGAPWIVGVRDPRNDSALVTRLPLADEAVSTSGDYERYFEADGVRYHHILVPGTGKSAREVRSVTILGPDATTTDGLSTTVFVLGVRRGLELVERLPGIEAVIVDAEGRIHHSAGLTTPR